MKHVTKWKSQRVQEEVTLVRWGTFGRPVLLFPTAGGDAEEVERFYMIDVAGELLKAGRVKIYSCDSVAGRALVTQEGSPRHRGWVQDQFQEYVYHEVVPAIRADCQTDDVEIITAGSSIGAFNALAHVVRYPDVFSHALCMSGTFDLTKFVKDGDPGPDFRGSSPVHFMERLSESHLERLRTRYVLFASGEGEAEDIGESWRAAKMLGDRGIPNRVDSWGPEWKHDWPLWRKMFPQYLDELTK
ncbi:MAG: esterase [Gemmatimonadota bacterium]|nr:MAG: esterase [Gemmatimonadota bacterium]